MSGLAADAATNIMRNDRVYLADRELINRALSLAKTEGKYIDGFFIIERRKERTNGSSYSQIRKQASARKGHRHIR